MCDGDVYEANIKDIDKKSDIATIKINPSVSRDRTTVSSRAGSGSPHTARLGDVQLRCNALFHESLSDTEVPVKSALG